MVVRIAADVVLALHVAVVAFVVLGLLAVGIGGFARWRWVRNIWFRAAHLAAVAVVVAQAWLGLRCPLTDLENALRRRAGQPTYPGGFVAHWVQSVACREAEPWVFTLAYTLFGGGVAATWIWVRPRRRAAAPPP